MYIIGITVLLIGVLFLHNVDSLKSTSSQGTQNKGKYFESPLFHTRLLQVVQKMTTSFQIHFLNQNLNSIIITFSD